MLDRQVVRYGALVWAAVGLAVAVASLPSVNADALPLALTACAVGTTAAVAASIEVNRHHTRCAGLLLILSAVTPTFFAWVLNVPALLAGLVLALAPGATTDHLTVQHPRD